MSFILSICVAAVLFIQHIAELVNIVFKIIILFSKLFQLIRILIALLLFLSFLDNLISQNFKSILQAHSFLGINLQKSSYNLWI